MRDAESAEESTIRALGIAIPETAQVQRDGSANEATRCLVHHLDTLHSIGDISPGSCTTVMEELRRRLVATGAAPISVPPDPR